jgi:hypothetical protein
LITIGSVTDFLMEDIATSCDMYIDYDGYIPEDTYHYYLADYNVFKRVLEPYLQGDLSFNEARKRLIRSSPLYFAESLGYVQVHHGELDLLARHEQTEELANLLGFELGDTEFLLYDDQYHGIALEAKNSWPDYYTEEYQTWTADWLDLIGDY